MKRISFVLFSLLCTLGTWAQSIETDPMVKTLQEELQYNFKQLQQQPIPAYFMSLRMADEHKVNVRSAFGAASGSDSHLRTVTPQVRLGNMELDNYKYVNQGTQNPNGRNTQGVSVPLDGKSLSAIRQSIWQETLSRYNIAMRNYTEAQSKMMTSADNEDKAACFSAAPVERFYQPELPASAYKVDKEAWKKKLNTVTEVFKNNGNLESGNASIDFTVIRTWMVNTEGTVVVQNRQTVRIMLSASIKAVDGMSCPLHQDFFAFTEDQLPSVETLIEAAKDMTERLIALRDAPVVDPYTGPAILSGPASGVFFHEIFGHRLEGHRLKTGGETFKKKVGEKVLPSTFNVFCDPTLSKYGNTVLNGHYLYDDEGVKARRVDNVVDGVLRNFLMSRVPLDGFPVSNGHGRTRDGNDPVSRQSNLIVETSKPYTEAQLRKMLIDEAKRQGKEFGYYFRTVTSGFTYTGEGNSLNSFNVSPIEVYRVFTDGRPDQLVRGVDLIGTPLSMFSNIVAAGDTPSTFTGECGAESGWVPVTATSPMIFVSQVETQRSKAQRQVPMTLTQPQADNSMDSASEDEIIFKAMEDEMTRTKIMSYANMPKPYFADYRIARAHQTYITSSLGGTTTCNEIPLSTLGGTCVLLGDKNMTSEVKPGQASNMQLAHQVNYDDIRRQLWKTTDDFYKYSLNAYSSKKNYFMQRPRNEKEAEMPEFYEAPSKEYIAPSVVTTEIDSEALKALANKLSAIFCDYPKLYGTQVTISCLAGDAYRMTSEGIRLRLPFGSTWIEASGKTQCSDGSIIQDNWNRILGINATLPPEELLIEGIRAFADRLMAQREAETVSEYYCGPVMFEGDAVVESFANSVISPILMAQRSIEKGSGINSQMFGKRVLDNKICISQLGTQKEYNGIPLIGSYDVDADGRTPEAMQVVDNGILKHLLCGRRPAVGCEAPTGNERFADNLNNGFVVDANIGSVRIYGTKTRAQAKMRSALANEAKKAGLNYAYIVRAMDGGTLKLYRYDVNTGNETLLRTKEVPLAVKTEMMHITDISREETISNRLFNGNKVSIIAPQTMIVENIEFNFEQPQPEQPFAVANPSVR